MLGNSPGDKLVDTKGSKDIPVTTMGSNLELEIRGKVDKDKVDKVMVMLNCLCRVKGQVMVYRMFRHILRLYWNQLKLKEME